MLQPEIIKSYTFFHHLCKGSYFLHLFQYQFNWNVRDAEAEKNGLFFEQTEGKNEETPDRTEGEYKVSKNDKLVFCNYG